MDCNSTKTPIMDVATFKLNFQGVESVAVNIIEIFDDQSKLLLNRIKKSIETNSPKELEISAHSLKGSVSTFHAERCRSLSFELEKIGKSQSVEGAEPILEELTNEVKELNSYLLELKKTFT